MKETTEKFASLDGEEKDLTPKQLKLGYWLTVNRSKLYRALIIFLIVFDVLLGGYNLYYWGEYMFVGYAKEENILRELALPIPRSANLLEHFAAKPVGISGLSVFRNADKVDALAFLSNSNKDFFVEFDYFFVAGAVKTPARRGFLLPGEEKPVAELGIINNGDVSLDIRNFKWKRYTAKNFKNLQAFIQNRLQFETDKVIFASSPYNRVDFNLRNNSFYGFRRVNFLVLLKNYETIVGVEKLTVDNFAAAEIKQIDLAINPGLIANSITLAPDLNVLDENAYMR